jgi:hypothetical protein
MHSVEWRLLANQKLMQRSVHVIMHIRYYGKKGMKP